MYWLFSLFLAFWANSERLTSNNHFDPERNVFKN